MVTVVCAVTVVSVVGVRSWCWSFRLSSALFISALFFIYVFKVIPLELFYYQTFFETWHNQHS